MASYSWNGGSGGWGTIANWAGGIPNSTTADATIAAAGTYTVKIESGKTYTVDSVTLADSTAILDVLGTLDLAGTLALLDLSSGTLEVAGLISGGTVDLNSGNTVIAAGGTINAAQLLQGGSGYINLNASSLTLGGNSTLQGYEFGSGDLVISGSDTLTDNVEFESGVTLVDKGTINLIGGAGEFGNNGTAATVLTIASGGTFDNTVVDSALNNGGTFSITNAGLFEVTETVASYINVYANFTNASTGTIYLAAGDDVSLLQGQDTLAGTIGGPGDLYIGQGATASLQASLALGAGAVTVSDGNTQVILESSRTIAGTFDELSGATLDLNGDNLTLTGNGTLNAYVGGGGTIVVAGTLDSDFYLASGSEELVTGTAIDATGNDRLDYDNGTAASILSIASTGTYDITQINGDIDYSGTGGTIINAGLFENIEQTPTFTANGNDDSYFNVFANFTNAATGTIYVGTADDISLIYGTNDLAGTITGPGDLYLGVTTTLEAALVLNNGRYLTFNGGGTEIYLKGNRLFNQQYFVDQNGATLQLGGYSATLSGGGTLSAYIAGPGTLDITGTIYNTGDLTSGVTEVLSGAEIQTGTAYLDSDEGTAASVISITSTGTYDITVDDPIYNGNNNGTGSGTIINAGLFEKTGFDGATNIYADFTNASTGTIFLGAQEDISLITGTSSLAGTIDGPGFIYFGQGATVSLAASLVVKGVDSFAVSDGNTEVILGGNETYAAPTVFTDQNSADILLNGNTLTLAGKSQFTNAYVSGNGELAITGTADVNGLAVIGTATVLDEGVITQDGSDELGTTNTAQVTLSITTHGTYDIINDSIINPQNGAPVINSGLFEKTAATGISDVYSVFTNTSTGTLDAASGTIRLDSGGVIAGVITGAGELEFNGVTIALAVGTVGVADLSLASGELVLQNNVADTHTFSQNGATLDLNGFTLSLGTAADYLANGYLFGPGTLSESARVDVNNYYLTGGAVLKDTGTITQDGGLNIGTFGADTGELTIASTGIYNIVNDSAIGSDGAAATVIDNSGLFEKTAATGTTNIYTIFNNNAGATLAVNSGTIALNGGGALAGTFTGAGSLYLNQYYFAETYTLASTAVVNVATFDLSGATLELTNSRTFADIFNQTGGDLNLGGFNATLSANDFLGNAYLSGPGTLDLTGISDVRNYNVTGGATLLDTSTITEDGALYLGNASTDTGTLSIASGATDNIINDSYIYVNGAGTVNNAGLLEKTADNGFTQIEATVNDTGTIDVVRGTIDLSSGGTIAGTLEGAGTLEFGGGGFLLQSAAVIGVATIFDYGSALTLAGNRTLASNFAQYYGSSTIVLSGHTLTLSGSDSLAGGATAAGAGSLVITGSTDLNSYAFTAGAVLVDTGTVTQDGAVQIGENGADVASISIASGAVYDILNDSYIYQDGITALVNAGLFEKTGSGTSRSYVQGAFTNSATIAVTTGILEEQALTNDGTVKITNATDQTDNNVVALTGDAGKFLLGGNATLYEVSGVAASQTLLLSGTANLIDLGTGSVFAGTVSSFAATDTIDLLGTTANGYSFAGNKLTLTENGAAITTIAVSTVTGAGTFSLVQDSAGNGTDIILSTPGSITQPGSITTNVFTVSSGDFNVATNWSAGAIPGSGNIAQDQNAGTVTDSGNDTVYQTSFNNTGLTFSQSAGTLTVIDGGLIGSGTLIQSAGATINDEAGTLSLPIEGTIAGTLAGAGAIEIGGNPGNGQSAVTLAAGAVLSVATLALDNVVLGGNLSYAGVFAGPGSDFLGLNGFTLDLTGPIYLATTYEYAVTGPGELILAGNAETALLYIDSSASVDVTGTLTTAQYVEIGNSGTDTGALTVAAGGTLVLSDSADVYGSGQPTLDVNGLLVRNGDYGISYIQSVNLTESSAGVIDAARGTIEINSDVGTLAGTLEGSFIDLNGDAISIAVTALLSVATLQINGGNTLTLGATETYAGNFDMSGGSGGTLALGSFGLDLTGIAELGGEYVAGSGTVTVAGSADISGMQLVGSETLLDSGTITEDGNLALGQGASDATALQISAGAVYDLITDNSLYVANGTGTLTNGGLFEKTADGGISYVGPSFTNASTGTIDVAAGTIDLEGGGLLNGVLEGAGELELQNNNGTFILASTAVLTVATLNVNDNLVLEHAETFTGDFIQTNNVDLNGFNLSLTGTAALDSSVQGNGTLTVTKGDISGLYVYDDAVMVVKGTVTQDGGFTMGNSGTDATVLSIASGAVFDLLTDNSINANGNDTVSNAGLFEKGGDYGTSYIYSTFNSTGTLDVVRGFLNFQSGGSLSGTVEGSVDGSVAQGAIIEAGGTLTIGASATVAIASISVTNGDLSFGGNLDYVGSLSGTGGSLSLNGHTISLAAPYLGGFYLTGPGTLDVSGTSTLNGLGEISSVVLVDKGTIIQNGGYQIGYSASDTSVLSIVSGATFDIITDNYIGADGGYAVNAGLFEKTADNGYSGIQVALTNESTGVINVDYGTLAFQGGGTTLGGTLKGAGEIQLDVATLTLSSSVVTVATLDIASQITLGGNLTYGGYFINQGGGDNFILNGNTLVLSGTVAEDGGFEGPGVVTISGTASVNGSNLFGGVTLVDTGLIEQDNVLYFSLSDITTNTLAISAGGIYDIQTDSNFQNENSAAQVVTNAGVLEKTGDTGLSELQVTLTNTGTLLVSSGTLQVDALGNLASGTLTGGTYVVDAGLLGPTLALAGSPIVVDAAAITLSGAGTELLVGGTLVEQSLETVASGGILAVLAGRDFAAVNTITDSGLIDLNGTVSAPALTIAAGGTLAGQGVVAGAITNDGLISATGTTLTIDNAIGGAGSLLIGAGAELLLAAGAASGENVTFGGSLAVLGLAAPSAVLGTLVSLAPSDTIDLTSLAASSATITGGDLIVTLTGGGTLSYALASANALDRVATHSDGAAGTDIVVFREATAGTIAPATENFGEHHAGVSLVETYTIGNTAVVDPYSEDLDGQFGATTGGVKDSGSFTGLAPGAKNSTSLHATLVTSTGGLISGTATVSLETDGSTVPGDGNGTLALPSETVTLTGTIFNYATASAASPNPISFGEHHVGVALSQDLTIKNTAVAGAYSENLDGKFSGTSGSIVATGTLSELLAGKTSTASLQISLNSGTAGVITGRTTLGLTSDGKNIDSLGTTALGSQTISASATLFNYATASTVAPDLVAFGEAHVGATLTQALTIANLAAAGAYSENLDAKFSGTSGVSGSGSVSELAAGSTSTSGLVVTLNSGTAGTVSGTGTVALTSDGTGIDSLGTTALAAQTVAVSGTLFNYATASVAPSPVSFGEHHVGDTLSQALTITNSAAAGAYSENLDISFSGTSSNLTSSGSISELGAGASNNSALDLVLNSATAGVHTGTATLAAISDGSTIDTLGTTTLGAPTVSVTGTLFNYATASTASPEPVNFGIVHVGQTISHYITIANHAASGVYSENLDGTFSGTTGSFATSGDVSELAAGKSSSASLKVILQTGTAGTFSGTTTLGLTSDGAGIDTLGTTALGSQTVALTGTVNNYATATIETLSGPGVLTGSGTKFDLNLGSVTKGSADLVENLGILNSATGPADDLSGTFNVSGSSEIGHTGFGTFTGVGAGGADSSPMLTLSTGTVGTFTETIYVEAKGYNGSGYSGSLAHETLIVTGTVTAAGAVVAAAAPASDAAVIPAANPAMTFAAPKVVAAASVAAAPVTGHAAAALVPELHKLAAPAAAPDWLKLAAARFAARSGAVTTPESSRIGALLGDARDQLHHLSVAPVYERLTV